MSKYLAIACLVVSVAQLLPVSSVSAATKNEIGISMSATLFRMNDKDLDKRLTDVEHLGATWIRMDFSWPAIQPDNPEVYHWMMYDRAVRVAGVHHLKVLAVLDYAPKWAQEPRCAALVIAKAAATKCGPKSNDTFAHFTRAAAIRYKGSSIRAWEIWNEPNLSSYWKTAQPGSRAVHYDPVAYASLANAAATQIRRNYPDSLIMTGGLAPMFEARYPKAMRQSDYLKLMLPHLKPNLFDGVGIHPYSWPVLPTKAATYNAFYTVDNGKQAYNLRNIMDKAGWSGKQLWGTEYGATTKGASGVTLPLLSGRVDHVSESVQAQIITQGIQDWRKKENVGPLFIHSDSDQWLAKARNEDGFGLRRSNGTKKPAYDAFQKAAQ